MGFSHVYSAQPSLLDAHIIDVEVDLSKGLHSFSVVGLPDKAVEESRDRVGAALKNSGFTSPKHTNQKVVISLAPADRKKEGPLFDLPIALSYLLAREEISFSPHKRLFLGELSLDGSLRKINGALPLVKEAQKQGFREVFLPHQNAKEAALIKDITVYGAKTLTEIINHLDTSTKEVKTATSSLVSQPPTSLYFKNKEPLINFSDIKGQTEAKQGLEIAAAGGHNIALYGPAGTGKTMLARAFNDILPHLDYESILETTSIHSVAGALKDPLITRPPFRAPHHTASYVSLIGGGANIKPGEVTLSHNGVLFLDEFPEFDRRVIESLRQPIEDRKVSISRAKGTVEFPSNFILVASMNPCPCGNYGVEGRECTCSAATVQRYQKKISGPIIDRIDMWIEVSHIDISSLNKPSSENESTKTIRERVEKARLYQKERFQKEQLPLKTNHEISAKHIFTLSHMTPQAEERLTTAARALDLSPRSYHRVIKLARTIADLENSKNVEDSHILEALQYRPKNYNA